MRLGFVIVGVILLIIGAAISFVPVVGQGSNNLTANNPYTANATGFSITGSIPASVTWTSSGSVDFIVGTCSNTSPTCSGGTTHEWWQNDSTGGTIAFSIPTGGQVIFGILTTNATTTGSATLTLAETSIGLILIIVGILLLIVGLVLKSKKQKAALAAAAEPSTPPATPPSPP
jgi:uncharacterized membrane protein